MIINKNSLADQIYTKIEKDIILGGYKQGEIISESEIAAKLGVSRTPVREAIVRLTHDNMLENAGKGIRVVGMTEKDIRTMLEIRTLLEGKCVREAAEHISDEDLKELEGLVEYTEFCLQKGDSERIRDCDNEFHDIIFRASENQVYYNILIPLHKKISKYRCINLSDPDRAEKSGKEHRNIYKALKAHDPDKAEAAAIEHVTRVLKAMEKNI